VIGRSGYPHADWRGPEEPVNPERRGDAERDGARAARRPGSRRAGLDSGDVTSSIRSNSQRDRASPAVPAVWRVLGEKAKNIRFVTFSGRTKIDLLWRQPRAWRAVYL